MPACRCCPHPPAGVAGCRHPPGTDCNPSGPVSQSTFGLSDTTQPGSADTSQLTRVALAGLRQVFKEGYRYQKAGVMLGELSPADTQQLELFAASTVSPADSAPLNQLIDTLNARFGRGRVRRASEGYRGDWAMKRERLTRAFTTDWNALAEVSA